MKPPLVAVAHGSRDPRSAVTVEALLAEVRRWRPGLHVSTAYLDHSPPSVGRALESLAAEGTGDTVVLPLLLTAAYHSTTDLPGALSGVRSRNPLLRVRYGDTLGPHPALTEAMQRRLGEVGITPGASDTAVVVTSAGSSDPHANATIDAIARRWARQGWWAVEPAYASAAEPDPATAVARLRAAGAPRVAVAPYLLAPGYFADRTREESLAAGACAVAPVLGAAPELARVVLERYDEVARIGTLDQRAAIQASNWQGEGGRRTGFVRRPTTTQPDGAWASRAQQSLSV